MLNGYEREKPWKPNLRRPSDSAWKKQRAKSIGRCASFFDDASKVFWLKRANAIRRFAFRSAGGSFATLIAACRIPSGTVCWSGSGGGSAERKQRKSSWPDSAAISNRRSSVGSHDCIRWTFCRKTQPPSFAALSRLASACASCPCPIEIET